MPQVHFLHRNRRYLNGDFAHLPYLAFEDYESLTLGTTAILSGWEFGGKVITYAGSLAYEDFETSTLSNNTPPGPDYGWLATGIVSGMAFSTQPSSTSGPTGATVSFSVVVQGGLVPITYQWQKSGVNMVNGGSISGATTATLTIAGIVSGDLGTSIYRCVVTDAQSISITSNAVSLVDTVADWVARVVINGGASPSAGTQTAASTFLAGLVTDGIYGQMLSVNIFAPDSLIASITPLIHVSGIDPWTNHNFVSGDLTVNGLLGNASNKYLETGFNPSTSGYSNLTMGFYTYSLSGAGVTSVPLSCTDATHFFQMTEKYSDGKAYIYDNQNGVIINSPPGTGFYAQNRISSTDHRAWFANSGNAFAQIGTTDTNAFGAYPSVACLAFANNAAGTVQQYSGDRLSFAFFAQSMTSTNLSNLYSRVQTLRTSLGGGFV
jgi:hypothetical protein